MAVAVNSGQEISGIRHNFRVVCLAAGIALEVAQEAYKAPVKAQQVLPESPQRVGAPKPKPEPKPKLEPKLEPKPPCYNTQCCIGVMDCFR